MDAVIEATVFVPDCRDHHQRKDLSAQGCVRSHDLERDIVADLLRASCPREPLGYLHLLTSSAVEFTRIGSMYCPRQVRYR
jgi:hypothetical protein